MRVCLSMCVCVCVSVSIRAAVCGGHPQAYQVATNASETRWRTWPHLPAHHRAPCGSLPPPGFIVYIDVYIVMVPTDDRCIYGNGANT